VVVEFDYLRNNSVFIKIIIFFHFHVKVQRILKNRNSNIDVTHFSPYVLWNSADKLELRIFSLLHVYEKQIE